MLTIKASHTVIPEEPTPEGTLWLSEVDQVVFVAHTPTLYVYKPKQNTQNVIETLKTSLSKILVHYYPMAGRLCYIEGKRLELNLNAKGATLIEAETTKTIDDYNGFLPSDSIQELLPKVDYKKPIDERPIFLVQVTKFQDNDCFVLGVCFFHPLADGLGAIRFINSWAKLARGEKLEGNDLPFIDRSLLKFSHTPLEPRFEHIELKPTPSVLRRNEEEKEVIKTDHVATLLRISPEQVDKLKKKANEFDMRKGSRPFSRYEAIAAHIWRCASIARDLEENQESVVTFNADIRTRMIPPLPENYFGNALAKVAAKGYVGEIVSKPLGYVSQVLRDAIEFVNDEFIRSQIDVIRAFESLDEARALFLGGKKDDKFGDPNFHFTSWMSMPVYETDFGWGKPDYMGLGFLSRRDGALILLSPHDDGFVHVCLHFQIGLLDHFKKLFFQDLE